MRIAEKLSTSLQNILNQYAWYGSPVYTIIEKVGFDAAYERPINGVHCIAEIVLHLLGWTEEALARLQGEVAKVPVRGDWPNAGTPDEERWQNLKNSFKLANLNLISAIEKFDENKWALPINDARYPDGVGAVSYEGLINGLIQHNIYHAGQITLINKMVGEA